MTYILTDVLRSKSFLFSRKKSTNCKMLSMKMRPSLKLRNVLILSKNLFSVGKETTWPQIAGIYSPRFPSAIWPCFGPRQSKLLFN